LCVSLVHLFSLSPVDIMSTHRKLFTTISVALLKCAPPIVVNNFHGAAPFVLQQPSPADITSIFTSSEVLLKVRKSYVPETASRRTGENVILSVCLE
jgi:hypothetical protein